MCTTKYLLSSHIPKYSIVAKSGKAATHKSKVLIFHCICHSPLEDSKQTEEGVKECRPHSSGYERANVASYQTSQCCVDLYNNYLLGAFSVSFLLY